MKKVGILTIHYAKSCSTYGAVLQAYALYSFLEKNGYQPVIVNYVPKAYSGNKIYYGEFPNSFDVFRDNFLNCKTKLCSSYEELISLNKDISLFVTGSDQVWRNWGDEDTLYRYLLDFVSDENKLISYAASFGMEAWQEPATITNKVSTLLQRFDHLSVRESSGVDILKKHFAIEGVHVVDPTLLLDIESYQPIIESDLYSEENVDPYFACMSLRSDNEFSELLDKLKGKIGLPAVDVLRENLEGTTLVRKDLGYVFRKLLRMQIDQLVTSRYRFKSVGQWLSTIKKAEFVLTDSFHGLVFSLLYQREFVCYANEEGGIARMKSILSLLGLENRLFYDAEELLNSWDRWPKIDYNDVQARLAREKVKSKDFLLAALEN